MYASRTTQFFVGLFAALGIAALVYLSVRLGRVQIFPAPGYTLFANFDSVAGLKTGDLVEIAGVGIGKVGPIDLRNNRAHVALHIDQGVEIDDDAYASIKSSGIIGDKFISIALGPGDHTLTDGKTIRHTQSSVVLEDLIGQLINSGGSSSTAGGASGGENASKPTPTASIAAPAPGSPKGVQ